jgi:hypothetical protein
LQDSIIATIRGRDGGQVWVERCGPKWLDLVGADRLRRHIFAVELGTNRLRPGDEPGELDDVQLFRRLGRLRELRYLFVDDNCLTRNAATALADALGNMRRLRGLILEDNNWATDDEGHQSSQKYLVAIGKMTQLEDLDLKGMLVGGDSLQYLAGLTKLKSLRFDLINSSVARPDSGDPLLRHLPALPRLELLDVSTSDVSDRDLCHLASLPRLKCLGLGWIDITDAGLAQLASLHYLEELEVKGNQLSEAMLNSLLGLKRLKALHIHQWNNDELKFRPSVMLDLDNGAVLVREREFESCLRALESLRKSLPGIVIDSFNLDMCADHLSPSAPWRYDPRLRPDLPSEHPPWDNGKMIWYQQGGIAHSMTPDVEEELKALKW